MKRACVVAGLVGLVGMFLLAGCHHPHSTVVVTESPPPPPPVYVATAPPAQPGPEVVLGPPPGPDFVIVDGYWAYRDRGYFWVARHYERRPGPNHFWVGPVYERDPGGHGYRHVPGHWEERHEDHPGEHH